MLSLIPEAAVWAILALPVASLLLILFLPVSLRRLAGPIAALCIGGAFALSLWCLDSSIQDRGLQFQFSVREWLTVGSVQIDVALSVDGLSALMLVVVTSVSTLVQVYSIGYMGTDPGKWRYFAYMSLFTASMLGLVLMDSLVMIYVFWELVGLSSYLLIGFWFHRPAAAAAAKKAFLVTRLGDLGFLGAIILVYVKLGTFNVYDIQELVIEGTLAGTALTLFALGIFAGAAGKSAQVPLHVWLPDAMEGPTPVSALIHAATMVAAGVYLVARMFPVFEASPDAMYVVAAIGGITAISAALIAVVMTDLKRVLAYSTISQLGYMMLALGIGGYVAAMFHLFTHAFFKALLFLGSGSVNHSTNTFDMRLMGGLWKSMPTTFLTFLVGSLSLAGIFPLAGFWSKDEILGDAWTHDRTLFWIALVTAGLTAFYMFRAIFLTFLGQYRGGGEPEVTTTLPVAAAVAPHGMDVVEASVGEERQTPAAGEFESWNEAAAELETAPIAHEERDTHEHAHRPHESPLLMLLPLLILMVAAIFAGFANAGPDVVGALGLDREVEHLIVNALPLEVEIEPTEFHQNVAIMSTVAAVSGIVLAWLIYGVKLVDSASLLRLFRPLHAVFANNYYLDVLYERVIVGLVFYRGLGGLAMAVDRFMVDGAVNGVGKVVRGVGGGLRYLQTGQFQTYGAFAFGGVVFTLVLVLSLGAA